MGCGVSLPNDDRFLTPQPAPARTLVPGSAFTNPGIKVKVTVPAYRGRSTRIKVKESSGYEVPPKGGQDQRPEDSVNVQIRANDQEVCMVKARPSLFTVAYCLTGYKKDTSSGEMDKLKAESLEAEAHSPFFAADGSLAGVLKAVPSQYKPLASSRAPAFSRSYIAYSTAPYFEGQPGVVIGGIDLEALYPWAKLTAKFLNTTGLPGDNSLTHVEISMATSDGFDATPAMKLTIKEPAFPDTEALPGTPMAFTVVNRAKEGIGVGRVKAAKPDNLVWHDMSVAHGVDTSLLAVAASTASIAKDRVDFEFDRSVESIGRAG